MLAFRSAQMPKNNKGVHVDPSQYKDYILVLLFVKYVSDKAKGDENAPIDRTDDAFVGLAKFDWHPTDQHLATLRYAYTYAEQKNGTFDVDSWGTSANAIEKVWSNTYSGSLISALSADLSNELRGQWSREDRPRPYDGPLLSTGRPLPDTAFDFGKGYRFGSGA